MRTAPLTRCANALSPLAGLLQPCGALVIVSDAPSEPRGIRACRPYYTYVRYKYTTYGSVRDQPFVESQFSPDPEPIAP